MSAPPPTTVRLFLLPVISFMFIPMGFFITETGTTQPGNFFFGAIVHFGTILYMITGIYAFTIRRRLINNAKILVAWRRTLARWTNRLMLIPMVISALGGFMIAHIELTQNLPWHFVGAMTCFGGAMVYMTLATILTLAMPLIRWLSVARIAICVTTAMCFVGFMTHLLVTFQYGIHQARGPNYIFIGRNRIDPEQNVHNWIVIQALALGSFCEWLMAFCYGFYMLTFAVEFGKVTVRLPMPEIDDDDETTDLEISMTKNSSSGAPAANALMKKDIM